MITLIGMGSGTPESLTAQGLAALQNAGLILGAKRLLEQLPQGCTEHRKALYQPEDVLAALADLPAPDAVFIGGTKGGMEAVVDTVLARNPNARICISAIALETLSAAVAALTAHGLAAEVTQIAVSRTRPAGRLHLLMANNPIFLITGERK